MRFSLVSTAWLANVALPLVIWDTPLPLQVHFRSRRIVMVLFPRGTNHLSQGVRHHAEDCVALGWILAGVVNDPFGAPGNTLLYLCLLPIWGAVGGDLLNPHYLWGNYGDKKKPVLRT
jgi:hypothetical protein